MMFSDLIFECRLALEADTPFDPRKRAHFNINDLQLPQAVRDKMKSTEPQKPKPRSEDPSKRQFWPHGHPGQKP